MTVELPANYRPSLEEDYMSPQQLEYFRRRLVAWRDELMQEAQETLDNLRDQSYQEVGDEADRASRESDHSLELRTRDRYRKLIYKIESALAQIDDGSYGYCEDTGDIIGLKRLEARPIATLSIDAQERREIKEKMLANDR
jgi:DnaK suppressor protein